MKKILFFFMGILISSYAFAQQIPPRPDNGIYDEATVMDQDRNQSLWNTMNAFWTDNHINSWVCILKQKNTTTSALAERILQDWQVRPEGALGEVLILSAPTSKKNEFSSVIAVSDSLKEKFSPEYLALVARQEVFVFPDGQGGFYPEFNRVFYALQEGLAGRPVEDDSGKAFFRKAWKEYLRSPLMFKIITGVMSAVFYLKLLAIMIHQLKRLLVSFKVSARGHA